MSDANQKWLPDILDCRELLDCDIADLRERIKIYLCHIKERLPQNLDVSDSHTLFEIASVISCIKELNDLGYELTAAKRDRE